MKMYRNLSIAILIFASIAQLSAQNKIEYSADLLQSKVKWIGNKPGKQHNGIVQINEGKLTFEKGVITSGLFTIDLRTIQNLDLEPGTWNDKLVGHLKSEDFFYVEKYPLATFKITKAVTKDKSKYSITGDMTIRGITHPITFDAVVKTSKGKLTATSSEIVLDRVKWDVKALSKSVFAELKDNFVDDEMRITVDLVTTTK